jgi:plastocyanin domain-containing protein
MTKHMRMIGAVAAVLGAAALGGCGGGGSAPQEVTVHVTEAGFVPPVTDVKRNAPVVLTITRTVDKTCATDVVFDRIHKGYDLPLNKPVRIELAAADVGDTLTYHCSMNMIHGVLVAK